MTAHARTKYSPKHRRRRRGPALTGVAASGLGAAVGVVALAAPALAAGERAVWHFDETSGTTAVDSSGNGNDGTAQDVVMTGSGYVFNGVSSKVVVPTSDSLNPGTAAFSFSVTFQSSVAPGSGLDYDLLRKGLTTTSGGEYKVEILQANGKARALCVVKDSAKKALQIRGTTNLTDGQVHTITCTRTSAGLTLVVDNLAPRIKSGSTGTVSNTAPLSIGAKAEGGPGADWFNGVILDASVS
ncbi:MAG TPA: LamG-like jellyroll fold domain-containing protein [Nocardioides sp.]|jgi:concanavalin A-like lectin/glucanase superfamily protein|nr:LamG-like jellyroll fold domain-containing protein [Nocardioides sp.]